MTGCSGNRSSGALFPKIGFLITNLPREPDWVLRFHNLATFLRSIVLPKAMADWPLTSLQLKLIHRSTGDACITEMEDRVVCHARAMTFQLAEVAVTGTMVRAVLEAIRRLRAPP